MGVRSQAQNLVVESLTPLFCLMDLLYHFCLIFSIFPSSSSELNSKTDFKFSTLSDFTSIIGNLSNGSTYTCYCLGNFTNIISNNESAGSSRGIFSKNSNGTTDFLVLVMGNSNILYSARLNNTGEGVTYNKTFSDDATVFAGTAIQSGDDLNDYTTPGIYYSATATITASLLNMPEIFASGFSMLIAPISTNNSQIIFPGGLGGDIYTRSAVSTGWQSWYKFEGTRISS